MSAAAPAQEAHAKNQRKLVGRVVSDKMQKTVVVRVERRVRDALMGKIITRSKKYHAHAETNEFKEGDLVEIAECRPLSKTKHHRLLRIVQKAPEKAVQVSAEEVMTGKAPEER